MAAVANDFRLQLRHGFYHAATFVALFALVGVAYVPPEVRVHLLAPLVLSNLLMGTFYFVAALVLLERGQGVLAALAITPLRHGEYVASKLLTLALLGLLENGAIILFGHGEAFSPLLFAAGVGVAAAVYAGCGLLAVAPYGSLNEMLLPSMLWVLFLSLPFLQYAVAQGRWDVLFWLHPLQPALVLLRSAFEEVSGVTTAAALVAGVAWTAVSVRLGTRAFARRILQRGVAA